MDAAKDVLTVFPSALGWMALQGCGSALKQLTFGHSSPDAALKQLDRKLAASATVGAWNPRLVKRLQAYAEGARDDFRDVELESGPQTEFQRAITEKCRNIGYGEVMSYGDLAAMAGYPRAARAVGNVMRTNRFPLVVPCHRVVGSGGGTGGYSAGEGIRMKLRLLEMEGLQNKPRRGKQKAETVQPASRSRGPSRPSRASVRR